MRPPLPPLDPDGPRYTLHEVEAAYIALVLAKHGGRKPAAAKELGISLKTLYTRLKDAASTPGPGGSLT